MTTIAAVLGLSACAQQARAPYDPGVCFYIVEPDQPGEARRQNVVATEVPQIEFCAARLEEMRVRFLGLGGSNREITGAYQGQYIFIDRRGVSFSRSVDGGRFIALARTGDGRLAIPGAIQRRIDAGEGGPAAAAPPVAPPTPAA